MKLGRNGIFILEFITFSHVRVSLIHSLCNINAIVTSLRGRSNFLELIMSIPIISYVAKNTCKFDDLFIARVCATRDTSLVSRFLAELFESGNRSREEIRIRFQADEQAGNSVNASFELHENRVVFLRTDARESLAALDRSIDRST